ncbi:sensor histidine kinase [Flavihumibacter sp. ZG627]|uniref:sensor histidine kinase n=1 Tax=Flavihumibacter sp. ZG627 TaxID=1463156 RepID=UPI000693548E|nr:sensor histidine kinase [Flavihumibacter sp. ZG627]
MKKWLWMVAGKKPEFALEHQVFNSTSFFITLFAFLASTANWVIGLHELTIWPGYLGGVISLYIFYISRFRKIFNSTVIFIYSLLVMVFMGWIYFFNDGSHGTINYLVLMFMTILLMITPRQLQVGVFILMYGSILVLLVLEYFHPEWRVGYNSEKERLADHIVTIFLAALFITVNTIVFRASYIEERQVVTRQNEELITLNQQIDVQKAALETLLKELHHRVKNNLQVISSLLALQSNRMEDALARESLQSSRTRIEAMALIHKSLYQNEDVSAVEMNQYLDSLTRSLATSFGVDGNVISLDTGGVDCMMDIDQAIPIGLIVNELVGNCFKHAFRNIVSPEIQVTLNKKGGEDFELIVADNGEWMQEEGHKDKSTSFGMKLVKTLAIQLDATVEVVRGNGTVLTIKTDLT